MKQTTTEGKKLGIVESRTNMGLFDFSVICIWGDYEKACKYVAWKFDDKDFDASHWDNGYVCRGKCFYRKGYVPVLWIPRKPRTPQEHATLAHECIYAVFHLFEWAGMPISRDTEEVYTHSVAHLIATILEDMK